MQSILYIDESKRTSKAILRLYNLAFIHAIETRRLFKTPKKLTVRKMFGQYHHALTVHAPQQFRIVPLSSTNAENEERSFNFLKTISTQTSNHHPDNVIANAFIRAQVSNRNLILKKLSTTILTFSWVNLLYNIILHYKQSCFISLCN